MDQAKLYGRCLEADLNSGQCRFIPFPEKAAEFLGGRGFNVWYLYHHLEKGTSALSPENILLLSCGLLTGSSAPSAARLHINSLSPLTGILGSSNIGGYAGAWLRSCNLSSIIVKGRSKSPVYLYVHERGADVRDAKELLGKDTFETQERIKEKHKNENVRILAIGPGGENRVSFAAIITEKDHAAGRTGMGAVMGSKNLKAVVIAKGSHKHLPADTPEKKQVITSYAARVRKSPDFKTFSTCGGAGYIEWANDFGVVGSKNYTGIGMDEAQKMDGKQLADKVVRSSGCFRCPVQCKAELVLDRDTPHKIFTRPEFEPIINFGAKCGLEDLNAIIRLDNLSTRLGIDTTSASSVIAFAMDLNEKGLLPDTIFTDPENKGLDLSWGHAGTMEQLICQMVKGKGLGNILRKGVREAARQLGSETDQYAAHVKGLELTAYHPGTMMGTALGYAVSSRGGDYNNVYASLEHSWTKEEALAAFGDSEAVNIKSTRAKGHVIKKAVLANIIVDSLGLCKVPILSLLRSFNLENEVWLTNGLTGGRFTRKGLFKSGETIAALEKWFNIRHGKIDMEDRLPDMFFDRTALLGMKGKKSTGTGLTRKKFKAMLDEYYAAMGWDENGIPPEPLKLNNETAFI